MIRGQRYLLAIGCLLISLAPAQAQQKFGFVPKHEQIQRLRGNQARRARANPFSNPIPTQSSQTRSYQVRQPQPQVHVASASDDVATINYAEPIVEAPITLGENTQHAAFQSVDYGPGCGPSCGIGCDSPGCVSCGPTCNQPTLWFGADYLLWSTRQANSPALASTSVLNTPREAAGVLDEAGVSTLFGGGGLNGDMRSGGRFTLGGWFSPALRSGIEVTYTTLEEEEESFSGNQSGFPILARPFYNTRLFEEDSRLINFPDLVRGDLSIRSVSEFDSVDVMFLYPASQECGSSTHFMAGYRQANLDEMIRFNETTTSLVSPTLDSTFELFDEFEVDNTFRGGQIGIRHIGQLGNCWSYDLLGKASLGSTRSRIRIAGQTVTTTSTGDVSTAPEGLLALSTNSGSHSDSEFGSLFEMGIQLRRSFSNGLQFKIGYTYLHWSTVARAVEQIDRNIAATEVPPDSIAELDSPRVPFERSGFWAQGLNLGLEYQF